MQPKPENNKLVVEDEAITVVTSEAVVELSSSC